MGRVHDKQYLTLCRPEAALPIDIAGSRFARPAVQICLRTSARAPLVIHLVRSQEPRQTTPTPFAVSMSYQDKSSGTRGPYFVTFSMWDARAGVTAEVPPKKYPEATEDFRLESRATVGSDVLSASSSTEPFEPARAAPAKASG